MTLDMHDDRINTALVVDDDPAHLLLLETTLIAAGYRVKSAKNGAQALDIFKRESIDIVLMDVSMPVVDGYEACQAIRSLSQGKRTPIILITSLDDHQSIEKAFNVDATDFIVKPVNWNILGHRVNYYLRASQLFEKLHESEENLLEAQQIALIGTWEYKFSNNTLVISEQVKSLLELDQEQIDQGLEGIFTKVHPDDRFHVSETINQAIANKAPHDIEYRVCLADDQEHIFHERSKMVYGANGEPAKVVATLQDITSQRKYEEKVKRLAYSDSLTGLSNREKFKELADLAFEKAKRNNEKAALFFLDLDNFKAVNDTLGHDAGDKLLQIVAKRLKDNLRPSDFITHTESLQINIFRLGGDEFTFIVSGIKEMAELERITLRIQKKLSSSIFIDDHELLITSSIGVAVFPEDGEELNTLLKHADIAMYKAKDRGRNGYQFYSQSINSHSTEKLNFEARLQKSIINEQLALLYQPQVDMKTGKIFGVEALLRWHDPVTGLVTPNDFIPIAEKSGFILAVDKWVINTACKQAVYWHNNNMPIRVSVNISGNQFKQNTLKNLVEQALLNSGLSPEYLEIELNEGVLIETTAQNLTTLEELKKLGVRLAIDDFGVGFSSLNYLRQYNVDTLKIDKSFISNIINNKCEEAITKSIISLAQALDLFIVAEGVEYEAQSSWLKRHNCDSIQGYFFSKPVPKDLIERMLKQNIVF